MVALGVLALGSPPKTTRLLSRNIHILDTGFDPLATSRKVCDAWRKRSEAKGRWHSSTRWPMRAIERVFPRKIWLYGSNAINRLLHGSKAGNAGSMWLNSLFSHGPLGSIPRRYWHLLKPPRSPTTAYSSKRFIRLFRFEPRNGRQAPKFRHIFSRVLQSAWDVPVKSKQFMKKALTRGRN